MLLPVCKAWVRGSVCLDLTRSNAASLTLILCFGCQRVPASPCPLHVPWRTQELSHLYPANWSLFLSLGKSWIFHSTFADLGLLPSLVCNSSIGHLNSITGFSAFSSSSWPFRFTTSSWSHQQDLRCCILLASWWSPLGNFIPQPPTHHAMVSLKNNTQMGLIWSDPEICKHELWEQKLESLHSHAPCSTSKSEPPQSQMWLKWKASKKVLHNLLNTNWRKHCFN